MVSFFVIMVIFNFMNSLKHYLLIIAISLLPIVSIFVSPDLPHTHDGPVHLARMAAYYKALADGQILPRWASDLNYGYGMPLFNFIYHLPYLLSSLFIFLKFNLVATFKIVLSISFLISGVSMFAFVKAFWKDTRKALLVALFYQFVPFRLVELWVRGGIYVRLVPACTVWTHNQQIYSHSLYHCTPYHLSQLYESHIFWRRRIVCNIFLPTQQNKDTQCLVTCNRSPSFRLLLAPSYSRASVYLWRFIHERYLPFAFSASCKLFHSQLH